MSIRETIKSIVNVLRYSRKSTKEEYVLYIKLVFIALFLIGGIGLVIHLLASTLTYMFPSR